MDKESPEFPDGHLQNGDGQVVTRAIVDGRLVTVIYDWDALQDYDPENAHGPAEEIYLSNRYYLEELAISLIASGRADSGMLTVTRHDVHTARGWPT